MGKSVSLVRASEESKSNRNGRSFAAFSAYSYAFCLFFCFLRLNSALVGVFTCASRFFWDEEKWYDGW